MVYKLAAKYKGLPAGGESARKGYEMTFFILYIRDLSLDIGAITDAVECTVPWDKVMPYYNSLNIKGDEICNRKGIPRNHLWIAQRLT